MSQLRRRHEVKANPAETETRFLAGAGALQFKTRLFSMTAQNSSVEAGEHHDPDNQPQA